MTKNNSILDFQNFLESLEIQPNITLLITSTFWITKWKHTRIVSVLPCHGHSFKLKNGQKWPGHVCTLHICAVKYFPKHRNIISLEGSASLGILLRVEHPWTEKCICGFSSEFCPIWQRCICGGAFCFQPVALSSVASCAISLQRLKN